jgi:leader peptidase (prepilin peptidase)/N-methyltransferase
MTRTDRKRLSLLGGVTTLAAGAMMVISWGVAVLPRELIWITVPYGWTLLTIGFIDLRNHVLHDALVLSLGAAGLVTAWVIEPTSVQEAALGVVAGAAVFLLIRYGYCRARGREGLGLGDVKLIAALGAWVGWQGLASVVLYAAASALIVLLIGALLGRPPRLGQRLPLGTHLCLGGWLVWLYGPLQVGG